ncbi:AtpZ/AtpI family protein [Bacillus tianshenii]|nr:AtpZ/AtpI family protein [Bacillus tianshenii]
MRDDKRRPLQAIALMSTILSQLAGSVLIGIFGGRWLDRLAETSPLFLIIGLLLGLATGTYGTYRTIRYFYGEES